MDLTVAGGANILFGPDPTFFGQPENFKRLAMSLAPNKTSGPGKILAPVAGGGRERSTARGAPSSGGSRHQGSSRRVHPTSTKAGSLPTLRHLSPETPGSKVAVIR